MHCGKRMSRKRIALLLLLILVLFPIVNFAYAADDSNAGSLNLSQNANAQSVTSAMTALSQNMNDSSASQLISQFKAQVKAGNYMAANSTLSQLQSISANNSNVPTSLKALLQSTSVNSGGVAVNTNQLASLLAGDSTTSGLMGESPAQSYTDLNILASLIQTLDPSLANELFNQADQINQISTGGSAPQQHVGGTSSPPEIKPPTIIVSPPSTLPSFTAEDFIIPLMIISTVAILYFGRKRFGRLIGKQEMPIGGIQYDAISQEGLDPNNPRHRVFAAFARMVGAMHSRGVSKVSSETHREFSAKCETRPERQQVRTISTLYEMARFSGKEVSQTEAENAEIEISKIESRN